ncbi:porin [Pseudooceanicola sp.]|uniref:porin n=1 Tax=Pseudooceanicola sp. TaxID=1914328 RepID=UPI00261D3039|nr:porin [Pseudooceanicola sp.]MDF1855718.1 porin [Pseudooceanicola sp.]
MKKILFATTALIATAGMAAADVKLSGYGRFGVIYVENANREFSITSRFRLNVDVSTTADNGITFGGRVRLQGNSNANGTTTAPVFNAARFYATSGGLTVAVGNITGAIEQMPYTYHGSIGLTGLGYANVGFGFNASMYDSATPAGGYATGLEVIYKADMFTLHASYDDPVGGGIGQQQRIAVAASGTFSGYTIALAYQDSNFGPDSEFLATVAGEVGPATLSANYTRNHADQDMFTVAAEADVAAATSIQAFFAYDESQVTEEAFGIGFHHNLGGGASLRGGAVSRHGTTVADFGVLFNF